MAFDISSLLGMMQRVPNGGATPGPSGFEGTTGAGPSMLPPVNPGPPSMAGLPAPQMNPAGGDLAQGVPPPASDPNWFTKYMQNKSTQTQGGAPAPTAGGPPLGANAENAASAKAAGEGIGKFIGHF